jgi:hypothetical protein
MTRGDIGTTFVTSWMAFLYTALGAAEGDPNRKDVFLQLAHAKALHARVWCNKVKAVGVKEQACMPSFRTCPRAKLVQRFDPSFVMPT